MSVYTHLLNMHVCDKLVHHTYLIARVKNICLKHEIYIFYLLLTNYVDKTRMDLKKYYAVEDELSDNVRQLLLSTML